jgi:hypothetical protein
MMIIEGIGVRIQFKDGLGGIFSVKTLYLVIGD